MAEQRYGRMPQKGTAESQAAKRKELFDAGTGIVLDSLPVIGGFRGMGRAADEFKAGNNFMGALELAGAIPMLSIPIKAASKVARGIKAADRYRTDPRYIPELPKNDPASRSNIPSAIVDDLSQEFDEFPLSGTQSVSFKNMEGQNVIDQVEVVDSFIRPVDVSKIKDRPDFSEVVSTAKIRELQDMGLVSKTLDPDVLDQELTQLSLKNRTRIDSDTGVLYEPTVLLKVKKDSFIDAPARRGTYQDGPDGVNFEFVEVPLDTFEAMQKRRQQATLTSADNLPDADTFEVPIELQAPEFLDVNKSVGDRLGDDVLDVGYPSFIDVRRARDFDGGIDLLNEDVESFLNRTVRNRPKPPTFTTDDLKRAPANQSFAYGGVVQNYQNGGPVGPPEDPQGDLFPDAIKEGIGTLVEYAPKVMKVAGRGFGDLVRSEPVSPPEFAVSRPTELTEFQMETETLLPEELDMISDSVIGKLYSDEVVNTLEDPEERAGLFLYADKPGVTDAPPKSSLLRDTVRRSLEDQKNAFDKLRYEGQAGLRKEVPLLSRSAVMQNVFNVLRDQIGPEAMSRIGDDRLLNIVEQSVRQSTVKGMADGGVVTLKDRAVNMNRGPRSKGIMQYVPYITGATNGY